MASVRPTDTVRDMVESFCTAGFASQELFLHYKFGRYQDTFPEKPYFLLSHCAHLLFSVWRTEEDGQGTFSAEEPRPTAFLAGVDFGALRYTDYKRRMLHADSLEEHWRNETRWFRFWMQVLEHLDSSGAIPYEEFFHPILAHVTQGDVLDEQSAGRRRRAFACFMQTDTVGRVLLHTLGVLDELMQGIVRYVAGLDPQIYILEQITLLGGLLSAIRRAIVCQTPARGPYTPRSATHWKSRFPLAQLLPGRTRGILTVVPRRTGGDIICAFEPESATPKEGRSWTRAVSSLPGTYEQELFATWSYETGEYCEDPERFPDVKACWMLQNEEAGRIETVSRLIDTLLDALAPHAICERLIEDVRSVSRRGRSRWKSTELPWTYIRQLDQVFGKLAVISREARAMSGYESAERVITALWPCNSKQAAEPAAVS